MGHAVELYISSAPSGLALRDELVRRLGPLVDEGLVRALTGPAREAESERGGMDSADLVVLLLCPDAHQPGSEAEAEIARALEMEREGRAVIVPVLGRPCDPDPLAHRMRWPRSGVPLALAPDPDAAFADVVAGVIRGISRCHMTVGDLYLSQQRDGAAIGAFHRALALAERLVRESPDDEERLEHLAVARDRLGDALLAAGDGPSALAAYAEARSSYEDLCTRAPGHLAWRRSFARCYESMGEVLRAMGDKPPAVSALSACLVMRASLAEEAPSPEATRDVYQTQAKIGHVLRAMGNLPAALEIFRAGLTLAEALAEAYPGEITFTADLALFCFRAATVLVEGEADDRAEARVMLLRARALYGDLEARGLLPEGQEIWPPAVESMMDTLDL